MISGGKGKRSSQLAPLPLLMLGIFLTINVSFFLHGSLLREDEGCKNSKYPRQAYTDLLFLGGSVDASLEGVSACLCVMDDNHFLTEWLAYHYHVANLRHLVITMDPKSLTKPTRILDRWRDRITIDEWDDSMFLPNNFEEMVQHRASEHLKSKTVELQNHRMRQAKFNLECLKHLKRKGRGWTLMIDTDEYLTFNPNLRKPKSKMHYAGLELPPIRTAGSLATLLGNISIPHPFYKELVSPCVPVYRRQFAARESTDEMVSSQVPSIFNGKHFQTLRWRKYGYQTLHMKMKWGETCRSRRAVPNKVIIDLRRLRLHDLDHPKNSGNPHRPLDSICTEQVYLSLNESPLMTNHYMGTKDQWLYRVGDKRGQGYRIAKYEDLNARIGQNETDQVRGWLDGFVDSVGKSEAARLLESVGQLEPLDTKGESTIDVPYAGYVYKVGDIVQANYQGDGYWYWVQVTAVHSNGFYNVMSEACSEEIATFGARIRRTGSADDSSSDLAFDFD